MYTQIRDEHVNLLRQHGEVTKSLGALKKTLAETVNEKDNVKCQLDEVLHVQKKFDELKQQSTDAEQSMKDEMNKQLDVLKNENIALKIRSEDLEANKSAEIAELSIKLDNMKENLQVRILEC